MKRFFGTPKRAAVSAVCITILVFLVTGIVFIAVFTRGVISGGREITLERAKEIALADAGLTETDAVFSKTKQEVERGISVYQIEFYAGNTEYEYEINGKGGTIYSKSKESFIHPREETVVENYSDTVQDNQDTFSQKNDSSQTEGSAAQGGSAANYTGDEIEVDKAKAIAAEHAGFSASEVQFSKVKLEKEHGSIIYEIEFYKDAMEYEYEINAVTGDIIEFDSEWND